MKKIELPMGTRFGRWTVIGPAEPLKSNRQARFLCRCECGVEKAITSQSLRKGYSTQCRECWRARKSASSGGVVLVPIPPVYAERLRKLAIEFDSSPAALANQLLAQALPTLAEGRRRLKE